MPDSPQLTAEAFVAELRTHGTPVDLERSRRHFRTSNDFLGVRMGQIFALGKKYADMPPAEIDKLLDSSIHEVRVGAVSIMGKQAVKKRTTAERRKELFELYLRRIDRIDTWDLVDVSGHQVIGGYLIDQPRDLLYRLAESPNWWERRVAIYSTLWFMRAGQVDDTFALAEILIDDPHDLINKVVGGCLRGAGDTDRGRLLDILDRYAATMPRVTLRFAIEHLPEETRQHYLGLKRHGSTP
ncbi:DNA alkylation repair protein [Rhizohabitans arisaemae]|uniref:DNA alkylation repair protein n=1 Tax=Rhizohabitans arisaemae TaxID=2720610 RepID=UPI0024B1A73A|nr:DNA alkylation repair protein [Rhizohabitans arisaemae]